MSDVNTDSTESAELDVRALPKPQRHPVIFERFAALPAADSFVLINNHDPKHLRQEFDRDHPGAYGWDYLESGPVWRIRITRLVNAGLPRVLCDTRTLTTDGQVADAAGAIWKLDVEPRHLDANVIELQPRSRIATHTGPDLDVLIHVLSGAGELLTDTGPVPLKPGSLVWLPRRSQRSITAAADGLIYLTVHPRRPALRIGTAPG